MNCWRWLPMGHPLLRKSIVYIYIFVWVPWANPNYHYYYFYFIIIILLLLLLQYYYYGDDYYCCYYYYILSKLYLSWRSYGPKNCYKWDETSGTSWLYNIYIAWTNPRYNCFWTITVYPNYSPIRSSLVNQWVSKCLYRLYNHRFL